MTLLLDNGSVRAKATKQLRQLADDLSHKVETKVYAVSLRHADSIPIDQLAGQAAQTFYSFMQYQLSKGQRCFIVLPLFFGESKALTVFIPEQLLLLNQQFGDFSFKVAEVVYPLPKGEKLLVDLVYHHLLRTAARYTIPLKNIILTDHGSPSIQVTAVRKHLAECLQNKLQTKQLEQAVMERREGKSYDFNGSLLEDVLLEKAKQGETTAIISLLFFLAGRHAGEGGDIIQICERIMVAYPHFKIVVSPLVSEHEILLSILSARFNALY